MGYYLCFNKQSLPEGQCKVVTLVSRTQATQWLHTPLTPAATLVSHKGRVVMVHTSNPSAREEYKVG